jgi:hypothetical protein
MSNIIDASFNSKDVETLLEAMDIWESTGNVESTVLDYIKKIPVPKGNKEAAQYIKEIKEYWIGQEKDIVSRRDVVREKAIFLKAKLMQAKISKGIDRFFAAPDPLPEVPAKEVAGAVGIDPPPTQADEFGKRQLAEAFIKDLGVWSHYEKFLADRANLSAE